MTATDVVTATTQAENGKSCPNSKEASPVKVKSPKEVQEDAKTHLVTGKRHLLVSDVPAAVTSLAQACELLSTQFGETAKECAESYYYYGKALLELSRLESGVLGNALDGVPEEGDEANTSQVEDPAKMTEDEKKEVEEKVGEALEENFQESLQKKDEKDESEEKKEGKAKSEESQAGESKSEGSKAGEAGKSEESKEMETTEDEGMEEGDDSEADESNGEDMDADKSTTEGADITKGHSDEKKDEEEEPSNLQLAWEMLELAKVVYTKQVESSEGNKAETEEKLCSTMLALGEVSLENENYKQAVEDIQLCLKNQESLPKDSRIVAETHYQLGVALGFNSQFEEAVESLNSAIKIIKERIKIIKEGIKSLKKSPTKEEKKEVTELEALIPEIEEKITDTKDMKKEAEAKNKDGSEGLTSSSGDKTKNVTSIAVKRKADNEGTISKKVVAEKEKTAAAS